MGMDLSCVQETLTHYAIVGCAAVVIVVVLNSSTKTGKTGMVFIQVIV